MPVVGTAPQATWTQRSYRAATMPSMRSTIAILAMLCPQTSKDKSDAT